MPARPEGFPCWADAMVSDLNAAEHFYGTLFGWTFEGSADEFGNYTQARSNGDVVAALVPQLPGQQAWPVAWSLYFAVRDADATAARVREQGGEILMEPTSIADYGRMFVARDPAGAVFGGWQAGIHPGFAKVGVPGAYAWSEIRTRDPAAVDAFYPAVFPIAPRHPPDAGSGAEGAQGPEGAGADGGKDVLLWEVAGEAVGVRRRVAEDASAASAAGPRVEVYFAVADVDEAVATVERLGGRVGRGPVDSPYGRQASVTDPQGAVFGIIDAETRAGAPPG
ncbi:MULTISPECIES: VOC family protein [unclassified Streptomyces]|uniref:VOC family protein n=1 Tax=unclassified Streptomyces TaxID=2593676 RepID=UPI0022B62A24|nr:MULTISPECIES: VOC family protein [unclassified Streptomyces]MCZ7415114.1 VOC family protein [Streptomyces sp. WMMC897]MCZ7432057.1 VOC family protein [Streptomyces sp. WMMC1477]